MQCVALRHAHPWLQHAAYTAWMLLCGMYPGSTAITLCRSTLCKDCVHVSRWKELRAAVAMDQRPVYGKGTHLHGTDLRCYIQVD